MAVGFGTPVSANLSLTTSIPLSMSGVTSGQPIVVTVMSINYDTFLSGSPITDTFSTHYTWVRESGVGGYDVPADLTVWIEQWVGYGGA